MKKFLTLLLLPALAVPLQGGGGGGGEKYRIHLFTPLQNEGTDRYVR